MSADNGVYILVTSTASGREEFRVSHAQAISNIHAEHGDWDKSYVKILFGECEVILDEQEAFQEAVSLARSINLVEYGIRTITEYKDKRFPK